MAINPEPINFDQLLERYSCIFFDAYGVLVHAYGALAGATERIEQLNRAGKPYYLLTNDAAKLPATAARRYQDFGLAIPPERIISSGSLLVPYFAEHKLAGQRCIVLGPEDSSHYVTQAGGMIVAPDADFDVLVVADETGYPFLETVETVLNNLYRKLHHQPTLPLILPNPDLIYPKGEQDFGLASGSIALVLEAVLALRYPELGLHFARLGKPHTPLFKEAIRRSGTRDAVMIGDQLDTDIRGANALGIDSVLLTSGVSGPDFARTDPASQPTYIMEAL